MTQTTQLSISYKRAIVAFVIAYLAITILGTILSFGLSAAIHAPATANPLDNNGYVLSEPFLPPLNLVVWMAAAWLYFRKRVIAGRAGALALGAFWLAVALPLDFIGFVAIKSPISLSPYDFYVGQFPWIYLIYIAVFISPMCYAALAKILGKDGSSIAKK